MVKSVHLICLGKKQNVRFRLPQIAVTKNQIKKKKGSCCVKLFSD